MKTPFRFLGLLSALALPFALTACDTEDTDDGNDLFDVAQGQDNLSVLADALVAAELDDNLQADGSFTVFAPNDAAFEQVLLDLDLTLEEFLEREDLGDILLFHVVEGELSADDLDDGEELETLQGDAIEVVETEDGIFLDTDHDGMGDAEVIDTDLEADNGVLHKVDTVLFPHEH